MGQARIEAAPVSHIGTWNLPHGTHLDMSPRALKKSFILRLMVIDPKWCTAANKSIMTEREYRGLRGMVQAHL